MARDTNQELFGELRSMLAQPDKGESWGEQFLEFLGQAKAHVGQEVYEESWLPYLASMHQRLPYPLALLDSLPRLEQACELLPMACFELYARDLDAASAEALASSPYLSKLTSLTLRGDYSHIGAAGAKALASSPYLSQLTSLSLIFNRIGAEGAKALALSPQLSQLTYLMLGGNDIMCEGVKALALSSYLSKLTYLNLEYNRMSDEGAVALASSPYLSRLEVLELEDEYYDNNDIGEEGAQALASSPYLCEAIRRQWRG